MTKYLLIYPCQVYLFKLSDPNTLWLWVLFPLVVASICLKLSNVAILKVILWSEHTAFCHLVKGKMSNFSHI